MNHRIGPLAKLDRFWQGNKFKVFIYYQVNTSLRGGPIRVVHRLLAWSLRKNTKLDGRTFLQHSAQAFTADSFCKIPCISTRLVQSLNTVHELSNIEKKKSHLNRDSNQGLLGEKRKRYLCAMPPP